MARKSFGKTEFVLLESNFAEPLAYMRSLGIKEKDITRGLLNNTGMKIKKIAKRSYSSSGLKVNSGLLKKSFRHKVRTNRNVIELAIFNNAKRPFTKNNGKPGATNYGFIVGNGGTMIVRRKGCFTFKIGDKWVRTKIREGKQYDLIKGPAKEYISSSEFIKDLDVFTAKIIKKEEEKARKKGANLK